jgi:hypothetical protein
MPPMPVTLFMVACSPDCFVKYALKAKPKLNDVARAKIITTIFFIFILLRDYKDIL